MILLEPQSIHAKLLVPPRSPPTSLSPSSPDAKGLSKAEKRWRNRVAKERTKVGGGSCSLFSGCSMSFNMRRKMPSASLSSLASQALQDSHIAQLREIPHMAQLMDTWDDEVRWQRSVFHGYLHWVIPSDDGLAGMCFSMRCPHFGLIACAEHS